MEILETYMQKKKKKTVPKYHFFYYFGHEPSLCTASMVTACSPKQVIFKSSNSSVPQVDTQQWTEDLRLLLLKQGLLVILQ